MNESMTPIELLRARVSESDPRFQAKLQEVTAIQNQAKAQIQSLINSMKNVEVGDYQTMHEYMEQIRFTSDEMFKRAAAVIYGE